MRTWLSLMLHSDLSTGSGGITTPVTVAPAPSGRTANTAAKNSSRTLATGRSPGSVPSNAQAKRALRSVPADDGMAAASSATDTYSSTRLTTPRSRGGRRSTALNTAWSWNRCSGGISSNTSACTTRTANGMTIGRRTWSSGRTVTPCRESVCPTFRIARPARAVTTVRREG
jgi:hypothetical protein